MEPKEAINAVEIVLRDLIERVLSDEFGPDWIEHCGTAERVQGWRDRHTEESKRRDGTVTEDRLLYYSEFPDLRTIIAKHWELFKRCFGEKKTFEVYMGRLEAFRNPEMHSRALLPFERALVAGMTGEIRNKVTLYRGGSDEPERYFARIEQVRDSFGNVATPSGQRFFVTKFGGITLHPADVVSFEGSAWDPETRPPTWVMTVGHGQGSVEVTKKGLDVDFEWTVTADDIAETRYIQFMLIGDRDYHAGGHDDGTVTIAYTVLPA